MRKDSMLSTCARPFEGVVPGLNHKYFVFLCNLAQYFGNILSVLPILCPLKSASRVFCMVTFIVTTTDDDISDNSQTSLCEAIDLAHDTPGADTVICASEFGGRVVFGAQVESPLTAPRARPGRQATALMRCVHKRRSGDRSRPLKRRDQGLCWPGRATVPRGGKIFESVMSITRHHCGDLGEENSKWLCS